MDWRSGTVSCAERQWDPGNEVQRNFVWAPDPVFLVVFRKPDPTLRERPRPEKWERTFRGLAKPKVTSLVERIEEAKARIGKGEET